MQEECKILFVPGPNDPGPSSVLPRPPLPTYFTEKLAEEIPGAVPKSSHQVSIDENGNKAAQ